MKNDSENAGGDALGGKGGFGGTNQETHPMTGLTIAEISDENAKLTAENFELRKKSKDYDDGDCAPYWLCRGMAQYVVESKLECERQNGSCTESSDCITEWCVPCAAKSWLEEQQRQEAPLPPNAGTEPPPTNKPKS